MNEYVLQPIGYVRNEILNPAEVPYNGAPSSLELLPEYAAAANGLEPGYIWVVTWLHQSERVAARDHSGAARGSFASRTPTRLNPVALTAARFLKREGTVLHVDALDVCDGTPLLDVKPYVREFDCVFGPAEPAWRRASQTEQRLARIARTIERFCGPLTPALAVAARLALAVDRDLDLPVNSPEIHWECHGPLEIAAGIQAVAGAPLGSPRFRLGLDEGVIRATAAAGKAVSYRLASGWFHGSLDAAEEALFVRVTDDPGSPRRA
jgi:tRNA-Thr(GGU) m(6)t(6)A37 methyltransferase TsaA